MKMTRLEWRYLQQIALDHPYYETHKLPLTEKEAKTIVEANIKMTGKEFVDSVYAKLGMTRPQEEKKRFAWLRNIGELFTVPPIRKIAVALLAVILFVAFFLGTSVGRAIAESVIQYIATLLDDGRVVVNRSDNETTMIPLNTALEPEEEVILELENSYIYVNSFEAFTAATGVRPTVLPFRYTELKYDYDEFDGHLTLFAEYETPKGTIVTVQYWNEQDLVFATGAGYTVYDADPSVYYSFDDDGTLNVVKIYEDTMIAIVAVVGCSYTVDEIVSYLNAE